MRGAFRQMPPGPSLLIGSDIPGVERHHLAAALANEKQALARASEAAAQVTSLRERVEQLTEARDLQAGRLPRALCDARRDARVIGPGLSRTGRTLELVRRSLEEEERLAATSRLCRTRRSST